MSTYTVYKITGSRVFAEDLVFAIDDKRAVDAVVTTTPGVHSEIWRGNRFVAAVLGNGKLSAEQTI